jgi:hypothetical protein
VCDLVTDGRRLVDLGKKVVDRPAPHEIDGATHRSGDLGRRLVMTEVLLRSMSTASGCGRHGQQQRTEVDEHRQRRRKEVDEHG